MADTKKLRSDIQKLKKALQAKGVSKTVKDKLQGQLDKAESELAASKKPAKSAKPKKSTPLNRLQSLVKKKKYSAYSKAGVDLKKDAGQPALPTGKRKSKSGKTYYEYRANRIDVKQPPKRYPKLEEGGEIGNWYKEGSNKWGLEKTQIFIQEKDGKYEVNIPTYNEKSGEWRFTKHEFEKLEDAMEDGYAESLYKDGGETSDGKIRFDMYGYIHANDQTQDGDEIIRVSSYKEAEQKAEKFLKENKYELVELYRKDDFVGSIRTKKNFAYSSRYKKEDFADGGMMAKGGEINVKGKSIKLKYVKRCCPSIKNDGTIGNYQYDFVDEMGNPFIGYGNSKEEALKSIEEYQNRFASGGYMADGGVIFLKSVSTYFRPSDMTVSSEKSFKNEGEIISLNDVDEEWINKLSVEDNKTIFNAMLSKHYKDSKGMADGGEIEVGDKVKYKNAKYHATVERVIYDVPIPYAEIRYSDGKGGKAYLEDLQKVELRMAKEYVNPDYMADGGETEKMALGGATVSTQYEKVEGTDYELKIKVYYDKGGISYATYKQEPRGYYLSVSPVQREKRDGYTVESYMAFSGVKTLLLPVQRQSPKAEKQAQEIAEKMMPEMKSYISEKVKEKAGFMKGGGYMAEGGMIKVEEDAYGKSAYIPYKGETFLLEWNTERPTKDSTVISDRSFRRLDEDSSLYQHLLVTLLKAMHENKVQYAEEGAKLAKGGYMAEGGVISTTHRLSK